MFASACDNGGDAASTPSAQTTLATSTSIPPSPTPGVLDDVEADGERVLEHVRVLSEQIGPRVSGTPQESEARDYFRAQLESYGYDVTTQSFQFDASVFAPATVEVDGAPVSALSLQGSGEGSVTGPLVVVSGLGLPADFPASTAGAIALIERGELTFQDKVNNAIAAGAIGVLVYNNEPGRIAGSLDGGVDVPVAGITQEDGRRLASATSPLTATITVEAGEATSYNVVARPAGRTAPCDTITGGHYDTVPITGGADDNASGSAAVLETARIVAARNLPGVHCFALFGAEEFGLFGSRFYVDQLSDAEFTALRGMVNLDVVGLPQDVELIGSEDMIALAGVVANRLGLTSRPSAVPNGAGSDHLPFINAGISAVFLYRHDPLIHTVDDTIARMDPGRLAETAELAAAILAELSN